MGRKVSQTPKIQKQTKQTKLKPWALHVNPEEIEGWVREEVEQYEVVVGFYDVESVYFYTITQLKLFYDEQYNKVVMLDPHPNQ